MGERPGGAGAGDEYDDPGVWESHPRMQARAASVRAEGDRKRRLIVAAVAAVILSVAAAVAVLRSGLLDVDHLEVTGVDGARAEQVRDAMAPAVGDPMVSVDPGALAAALREALPWVARAEVDKDWPSTLRVEVEAAEPVLFVRAPSGRAALVDGRGVVIGATRTPPASLMEVSLGQGEAIPAVGEELERRDVVDAVDRFPEALRAAIAQLEVSDDQVRLVVRGPAPDAGPDPAGDPTTGTAPGATERAVEWCTLERAEAKASVTTALLASLATTGESWTTLNVCVPTRPTKR